MRTTGDFTAEVTEEAPGSPRKSGNDICMKRNDTAAFTQSTKDISWIYSALPRRCLGELSGKSL
jgi:hypothetical protein